MLGAVTRRRSLGINGKIRGQASRGSAWRAGRVVAPLPRSAISRRRRGAARPRERPISLDIIATRRRKRQRSRPADRTVARRFKVPMKPRQVERNRWPFTLSLPCRETSRGGTACEPSSITAADDTGSTSRGSRRATSSTRLADAPR